MNRSVADWPLVTVALIALSIAVFAFAPEPSPRFDALVLDRASPRPWAWLTAHLLHTDLAHLGWNVLALGCLGLLGERGARIRFTIAFLAGVVAVDVWFGCIDQSLRYYCGLSGALNAVLLATLYALRRTVATRWLVACAGLVAMKVGWEWHSGVALFTHSRWPSAVGAHVAGFIAGAVVVAALACKDRAA